MNVLYTCDDNYIWLMGISVISLFENNKGLPNLNVYLLGEQITDDNKARLQDISNRYNRKITIIDVPAMDIPDALVSTRWPISAFIRLYSGELLPKELDKVLYLDCDTIVKGSLGELETWDMSGKVFCGVKDCISAGYKRNIGMDDNGVYVNAGVLLMDLSELRKVSIKDRLANFIDTYKKLINYADQDVLNGAFCGEIGVLPSYYNLMTIACVHGYDGIQKLRKPTGYYSKSELNSALNEPIVIHYTTNMRTIRPWFKNANHPLTDEFRKYMDISPWNEKKLAELRFTSSESQMIGIVELLPDKMAQRLLGFLHSTVKPWLIKIKTK